MKRLTTWLRSDRSILRGAVVLGSGAATGQVILIAATPILARLYTHEQIGQFALYLSYVGVAIAIAPLGYQRAIPTASTQNEAATLASGVLLIQPAMCLILAGAQWGLMRGDYLGFGALPKYTVILTGFSVLVNTVLLTLQYWFIRAESYPIISKVPISQNLGRASLQIAFGAGGVGLFGLIAGDFAGRLLGLSGMLRAARRDLLKAVHPFQFVHFQTVFRKFRKFLFPQLPSIVINTVARMLPIPLLVHYYGTDAAGLYAMVERILQVPVAFVSNSLGDALHGRIGHYSRTAPERIMQVFLKTSGGLLLLGILPTLAVVIWGKHLFALVLGDQWATAGELAGLLAPLALATLVVSTPSRVVYIFQAFATEFWYNITSLIFVIGTFWVGHQQGLGLIRTVTWLARLGVVAYVLYFVLLLAIVRRGIKKRRIEIDTYT